MTAAPTRRTVVRGLAWSAPLVAVASAAPAFATSTTAACTAITMTVTEDGANPASDKAVFTFVGVPAGATLTINTVTATSPPGGTSFNVVGVAGSSDSSAPYQFIANNNNSYKDTLNGGTPARYQVSYTVTGAGAATCSATVTTL